MLEETRSAPDRVAAMLARDGEAYDALAAELRRHEPAHVVTVARGSSDHAALYLASLVGIVAGRITASLPPSLITRYGAKLAFERALVVSLSQSGASPDIVRTLEAARAGGAITAAIVNQADSALAHAAAHVLPQHAGPEKSVAATKSVIATLTACARLVATWQQNQELLAALTRLPERLKAALACDWSAGAAGARAGHPALRGRPRAGARDRRGDRAQAEGDLRRPGRGAERRRDPARAQGSDRAGLSGPGLRPGRSRRRGCPQVRGRPRRGSARR